MMRADFSLVVTTNPLTIFFMLSIAHAIASSYACTNKTVVKIVLPMADSFPYLLVSDVTGITQQIGGLGS